MINDCTFKADFQVTTVMEGELSPLTVSAELDLVFGDADPHHQAIALERIRFLFHELLNNSVIGGRDNPTFIKIKEISSSRFVDCWDDPFDQFMALMIYFKVTAILEDAGYIKAIRISGDSISPDVEFRYDTDTLSDDILDIGSREFWYHRSDTNTNEVDNGLTWDQIGLGWDPTDHTPNKIRKFVPRIVK